MVFVDFDGCPESIRAGAYGGHAGMKAGVVHDGENYMIKFPKSTKSMDVQNLSYTTSPLSEYIGSHVYEILGYDVHKTLLGKKDGKVVVGCRDFCGKGIRLLEMRVVKNYANKQLMEMLERELASTGSKHSVDLEEMLIHLEMNPIISKVPGVTERFWDQVVVDIFLNNNDRNNGNWGLLVDDFTETRTLAPIYDNGASFSPKSGDEEIKERMSERARLEQSATKCMTGYSLNGHMLASEEMLGLDHEGLKKAIVRNVPLIKGKMREIGKMLMDIPQEADGLKVCSDERKDYYAACMEIRLEKLLVPAYEKAVGIKVHEHGRELGKDPVFEPLRKALGTISRNMERDKDSLVVRHRRSAPEKAAMAPLIQKINSAKRDFSDMVRKGIAAMGEKRFSEYWAAAKSAFPDELKRVADREARSNKGCPPAPKAGNFVLICGLPGSGKTRYAQSLKEEDGRLAIVSLAQDRESCLFEEDAQELVRARIFVGIASGADVVYEASNIRSETRESIRKIAEDAGAGNTALVFLNGDIGKIRSDMEAKGFDLEVFDSMARSLAENDPAKDKDMWGHYVEIGDRPRPCTKDIHAWRASCTDDARWP